MDKQNKIRIYIAGPMRGHNCFNFPAFFKAEKKLQNKDIYDVVNPARIDEEEGFNPNNSSAVSNEFLRKVFGRDIKEILKCDAIYMLKSWDKSLGAKIEHDLASLMNMHILYEQ
jgi:hypothetical protein